MNYTLHLRRTAGWLLCLSGATTGTLQAQSTTIPYCQYTEYKSGQQLVHSRVGCFAQDDQGFLWMGLWNGLCRFDGETFTLFSADPANNNPQLNNRISQIEMDSRQNLWCVTNDSRLYRFDRRTSTFTAVFDSIQGLCFMPKTRRALYALPAKGIMWVVLSDGSCLRMHDGDLNHYERLVSKPNVSNMSGLLPAIYYIYLDRQGREWILSDWGTQIYQGPLFTDHPFFRIHELGDRIFLFSPDGAMAECEHGITLKYIDFPQPVHKVITSAPVGDSLLTVATDAGLYLYNIRSNEFRLYRQTTEGRPLPKVDYIQPDSHGRLWLFTADNGFYRIDADERLRWFPAPEGAYTTQERYRMHLMFEDAQGVLWGKPEHGGLLWFDEAGEQLHSYTEAMDGNHREQVSRYNNFCVDHQHNLWIASQSELLYFTFQDRQFRYLPTPSGQDTRALLTDEERHGTWIGDLSGRLMFRSADGTLSYMQPDGTLSGHDVPIARQGVYTLLRDQRGTLWAGTKGDGLFRFTPTAAGSYRVEHYTKEKGNRYSLNNNNIYDLCEDEERHLWVGTYGGGLNLVDEEGDTVRFINVNNRFQGYPILDFAEVRCLATTGNGALMVGTTGGLLTVPTHFSRPSAINFYQHGKRVGDPSSLPGNDIMAVMHSSRGKNYVCSYGLGISEVVEGNLLRDTLHYVTYMNRVNAAGNVVIAAGEDRSGRLWTLSDGVLSMFNPDDRQFTYYDRTDFDRDYRFTEATPCVDSAGVLWLGLTDGVLTFHTDSLHKSSFTPQIAFTGYRYPGDVANRQCNDMTELTLPRRTRSVCLSFAALDFHPSQLTRYAYRLDGVDHDWNYTDKPEVNYVNLPSGTLRLHIRSTNHDGQWCANERVLLIHVPDNRRAAAWWLLLLVPIALALYLWRRRRPQKQDQDTGLPPLI